MSGFGKPPVTALQEFCAKKNIPLPTYEWIDSQDCSFACKAEAASVEAYGDGRSKREAKHNAAADAISKLKLIYKDMEDIPLSHNVATPAVDMIVALRDYCVKHNHPLPTFDIVQQTGPAEAPEFTVLCCLSSIKRYGKANNKKDARQRAAYEVFKLILEENETVEHHMQVAPLNTKMEDVEAERYHKFKTYRELTDSKIGETPGLLLCDRHNYFTKFFDELKNEAFKIINTEYDNLKTKALDIMTGLKIKPRTSSILTENGFEKFLLIELDCEYDVVFAGPEEKVYKEIIDYFEDML